MKLLVALIFLFLDSTGFADVRSGGNFTKYNIVERSSRPVKIYFKRSIRTKDCNNHAAIAEFLPIHFEDQADAEAYVVEINISKTEIQCPPNFPEHEVNLQSNDLTLTPQDGVVDVTIYANSSWKILVEK